MAQRAGKALGIAARTRELTRQEYGVWGTRADGVDLGEEGR